MKEYALITGASSGIGQEVAYRFAEKYYNLILVARRQDRLDALKAELEENYQVQVVVIPFDLSLTDDLADFYQLTRNYVIKYWINNAGFSISKDLLKLSGQDIEQMVRVNDIALMTLSNLYAADYKDHEGAQLVNVSSVVGYALSEGNPLYSATKFMVSAYTEGLDHYLKVNGHAMRAKVLAPAATATEFTQVAKGESKPVDYSQLYDRYHTAEQMAGFLIQLLDSSKTVAKVNLSNFQMELLNPQLPDLYDN